MGMPPMHPPHPGMAMPMPPPGAPMPNGVPPPGMTSAAPHPAASPPGTSTVPPTGHHDQQQSPPPGGIPPAPAEASTAMPTTTGVVHPPPTTSGSGADHHLPNGGLLHGRSSPYAVGPTGVGNLPPGAYPEWAKRLILALGVPTSEQEVQITQIVEEASTEDVLASLPGIFGLLETHGQTVGHLCLHYLETSLYAHPNALAIAFRPENVR